MAGDAFSGRLRISLVLLGGVELLLASWLTPRLTTAASHPHGWPRFVWIVLLVAPALATMVAAALPTRLLAEHSVILRGLPFCMLAGGLVAFVYAIPLIAGMTVSITYLFPAAILGSAAHRARIAAAAEGEQRDGAEAEDASRPAAPASRAADFEDSPPELGQTQVTPYLGPYREAPPGEVKPPREMFPNASDPLTYLYDGEVGVSFPVESVQRRPDAAPNLRRRARKYLLGAPLAANVLVAAFAFFLILGMGRFWPYAHQAHGAGRLLYAVTAIAFFTLPFLAFFAGATTLQGSRRAPHIALVLSAGMVVVGLVMMDAGAWDDVALELQIYHGSLYCVLYVALAFLYLRGIWLCRRADAAPGW